jgi:hypothetical protein
MANYRRITAGTVVFRCLLLPSSFLCVIFHRQPIFQWIAVGALAVWLLVSIFSLAKAKKTSKKEAAAQSEISHIRDERLPDESVPFQDQGLILIRQLNFRITEQLKSTYPMISWLWVRRPTTVELAKGGVWRIQVSHADPFNYGEVTMTPAGQMQITMLQVTPLDDAQTCAPSDDDLKPEDVMERVDVAAWYSDTGVNLLGALIDDLNAQGHRRLIIHEDGEVCVSCGSELKSVDRIKGFPPRMTWSTFCDLLKEDDITAQVQPDGLSLAW